MPEVVIEKPAVLDILETISPALSSTNDVPKVETKPDASPPEAKPEPTAPEEKAAPAAETIAEEPAPSEQPDDAAAEPEPKKAKGVQKRIDELTRQREDERRRALAAEERLDRALKALEKAPKETPVVSDTGPQKPAFDPNNPEASNTAFEKYLEERTGWVADQKARAILAEEEKKRTETQAAEQTRIVQEAYRSRVEKAKEKYADYTEKAESPDIQVSIPMASAIAHSEEGPEIAYYLGTHPDEATRISKLVPQLQLVELGKIVAKITTPPPSAKPISAAPAPGKPIKASSETVRPDEELSMEEYAAKRKKEWAESRRPGVRH